MGCISPGGEKNTHYFTYSPAPLTTLRDKTELFISKTSRRVALESTQSLTEMSTKFSPGGKGGRFVRLTLSPSCTNSPETLAALASCNRKDLSRPVQGLLYLYLHIRQTTILCCFCPSV